MPGWFPPFGQALEATAGKEQDERNGSVEKSGYPSLRSSHIDRARPVRRGLRRRSRSIAVGRLNGDLAAAGMALRALVAMVHERVFQLVGIGVGAPQPTSKHCLKRNGFTDGPTQKLPNPANKRVGIDGLGVQRLQAREGPAGGSSGSQPAVRPSK